MPKKPSPQKSKATGESTKTKTTNKPANSSSALPSKIFAQVSPRSVGGVSMFEGQNQIQSETVGNFFSDAEAVNEAVARLQEQGFEILQISPLTINIAGSPSTYKKAFNTEIVVEDRPVIKGIADNDNDKVAQFLETPETNVPGLIETTGTVFENSIEGVALEEPRYFMAPSMFAPLKNYWHLDVPAGISLGCNADKAHRTGITGKGVKVAMVDTGHYKHPFFVGRGYNVAPVVLGPATANPLKDEVGHGTGESANIFAVAPDVQLLPVKINFVNSIGAFNAAAGLNPDIITCSWGSSKQFPNQLSAADMALATAIAAAVASGITVVFSAGNGHWGFPGQHPDVISAGGVYMNQNESLRASDYASGFISNIYPNRRVPDLCGLVGLLPKAIYIMLPLEPSDDIDVGNAGGAYPNGDETVNNDGWAAFSGTSAAAPQLAGTAALIKQACPKLKPAAIKDIMRKTARDITVGNASASTGGNPATVGPDSATGDGLVDAYKAVMLAKVKCLGPIITTPITPIGVQPIKPIGIQPPIKPPIGVQPIKPIQPIPIQPIRPIAPIVNPGPVIGQNQPSTGGFADFTKSGESAESSAGMSEQSASQLSETDVQALEDLIINSDFEMD